MSSLLGLELPECLRSVLEFWLSWSHACSTQVTRAMVSSWVQQLHHVQKTTFPSTSPFPGLTLSLLWLPWALVEGWIAVPHSGQSMQSLTPITLSSYKPLYGFNGSFFWLLMTFINIWCAHCLWLYLHCEVAIPVFYQFLLACLSSLLLSCRYYLQIPDRSPASDICCLILSQIINRLFIL